MNIDYNFNGITAVPYGSGWYALTVVLRYTVLRKPLQLHYTAQQLDSELHDFHIATIENGKVLACLILTPLNNEIIKMRQVAVDENLQGKGLGKKIVAYSETFAKEKGYTKMELHARQTAVPFYLSMQYTIVGDEFTEVGIPHYKMVKFLA